MTDFEWRPLPLYIPACDFLESSIARGSAIVGTPATSWLYGALGDAADPRICIDFEGAQYGQVNMRTLADRAIHAGGRHIQHYPTRARMVVEADRLLRVGTFHGDHGKIDIDTDGDISRGEALVKLARWIDLDVPEPDDTDALVHAFSGPGGASSRLHSELQVSQ